MIQLVWDFPSGGNLVSCRFCMCQMQTGVAIIYLAAEWILNLIRSAGLLAEEEKELLPNTSFMTCLHLFLVRVYQESSPFCCQQGCVLVVPAAQL
jgi:hypothetical protein